MPFFQALINKRDSVSDETSPDLPRSAEAVKWAALACSQIVQASALEETQIVGTITAILEGIIKREFPTL